MYKIAYSLSSSSYAPPSKARTLVPFPLVGFTLGVALAAGLSAFAFGITFSTTVDSVFGLGAIFRIGAGLASIFNSPDMSNISK